MIITQSLTPPLAMALQLGEEGVAPRLKNRIRGQTIRLRALPDLEQA